MFPAGGGGSAYFVQSQQQQQQLFHALDGIGMEGAAAAFTAGGEVAAVSETHCHALLYNLSVLKDKVRQLEPVVGVAVGHDGHGPGPVVSVSVTGADAIIQEIITAASSMMYAFQQLCVGVGVGVGAASTSVYNNSAAAQEEDGVVVVGVQLDDDAKNGVVVVGGGDAKNGAITADDDGQGPAGCCSSDQQAMDGHAMQQWQHLHHHGGHGHGHRSYYIHSNSTDAAASSSHPTTTTTDTIIERDAAELLARYTHYCQVCGKGFKRDANLRMHMRAHGDEYKTKAALANPTKSNTAAGAPSYTAGAAPAKSKYSCPQEGCRWNRKHAKFQPLKSVICAKNHYKRSHCPKMYVCNRCNRKHFSVLSDLRTHEKHCGDHHRWLCSCGTNFSRKDKLTGHVSLFAGHEPVVPLGEAGGGSRHGNRSSSSSSTAASQLGNCAATGFGMS